MMNLEEIVDRIIEASEGDTVPKKALVAIVSDIIADGVQDETDEQRQAREDEETRTRIAAIRAKYPRPKGPALPAPNPGAVAKERELGIAEMRAGLAQDIEQWDRWRAAFVAAGTAAGGIIIKSAVSGGALSVPDLAAAVVPAYTALTEISSALGKTVA